MNPRYPRIKFSLEHQDWEVELNGKLTICIDKQEYPDPGEAVMQAMIWELYPRGAKSNKRILE